MSTDLLTSELRCDLTRLERTNMVTKLEDRVKIDLVARSKLILDNLQLCDPSSVSYSPEMLKRIAVQFNQGALLQYQYGDIERAETLCRASIEFFAEVGSYSPHRALCLASMVAPYVNLARIYGQKGEVKESLSIFEDIYRFGVEQQDLHIFEHRIRVADGPAMIAASEPTFPRLLLSCRVVEAARVLQTVEDYSALLSLVETNADLPEYQDPIFKQYLLEVRSRALLHLGQYDMALAALEECCRLMSATNTDRIVAHLLLSQIYRQWGRDALASETLDKLEAHLSSVEHLIRRLPILRQIAYRLALEHHEMGDDEKAVGPAEKAFKWCTELNDQPGSIKAAILLLRMSSRDESLRSTQRHWHEELRQLAAATFFRLDRACAYWELGVLEDDGDLIIGREFLENSYELYRSVPFVDSRRSCKAVEQTLNLRIGRPRARTTAAWKNSPSIDSTFAVLLEYVPHLSLC